MTETAIPTAAPSAGPVIGAERIVSLDVLRGVAVLGILALNIQSFSMIGAAYMNPTAHMDLEGANYVVWHLTNLFGDQKFMAIFSMLFGAGIVLMAGRAERSGRSSAPVHYRRMLWLALFGLMHAHLLWYGDILWMYAVCGIVAWLFRRRSARLLIGLGVLAIFIGAALTLLYGLTLPNWGEQARIADSWAPASEMVTAELETFRGSWLEQMKIRVPMAIMFETFLLVLTGFGWKVGGLILIGMGLFKTGVFSATRSVGFYAVMAFVCLGVGLPAVEFGIVQHEAHGWSLEYSMFQGSLYNFVASVVVALGYVALVMLACRTDAMAPLLKPVAAAGRMALSNYLLQTIICTTIFYGHGFGRFGFVERTGQVQIVMAIWIAQLIWSPIWLAYFRFGPFEWLWRTLTYWRVQSMRNG